MATLEEIKTNVEGGKTKIVPGMIQEALEAGIEAGEILDSMIDAMSAVGERFSAGTIFVPEMLIAAKAMSKGVEIIKPHLAGKSGPSLGTCVIGTVQGDLHDIGKNLVAMMVESAGFNLVDLGVDVSPEKFIEAVKNNENVTLIGLSGLLSTTMPALKNTVKALRESGIDGFKIIVGGAPVTQEMADDIGADGYASDAGGAAVKAKEIVAAA